MARETVIKIKHSDGNFYGVVPGVSPKILEQQHERSGVPKLDVNRLPSVEELKKNG